MARRTDSTNLRLQPSDGGVTFQRFFGTTDSSSHLFADANDFRGQRPKRLGGGAETSVRALSQKNRLASAGSGDQFDVTKTCPLCYDYVTITLFSRFWCNFKPFECPPNRSVRNCQPISESAHRLDVTAAAAELIAQAAHVGVYGSGINDRVVSPNITQQPIPPLNPSFALH
jgi:hypothetical protein